MTRLEIFWRWAQFILQLTVFKLCFYTRYNRISAQNVPLFTVLCVENSKSLRLHFCKYKKALIISINSSHHLAQMDPIVTGLFLIVLTLAAARETCSSSIFLVTSVTSWMSCHCTLIDLFGGWPQDSSQKLSTHTHACIFTTFFLISSDISFDCPMICFLEYSLDWTGFNYLNWIIDDSVTERINTFFSNGWYGFVKFCFFNIWNGNVCYLLVISSKIWNQSVGQICSNK